jgi:hypothetical protein
VHERRCTHAAHARVGSNVHAPEHTSVDGWRKAHHVPPHSLFSRAHIHSLFSRAHIHIYLPWQLQLVGMAPRILAASVCAMRTAAAAGSCTSKPTIRQHTVVRTSRSHTLLLQHKHAFRWAARVPHGFASVFLCKRGNAHASLNFIHLPHETGLANAMQHQHG